MSIIHSLLVINFAILIEMPFSLAPYGEKLISLLRITLAVIFIWFGLLKVFGYNPVYDLIYHSLAPIMASGAPFLLLGVFETAIGALLLLNRFVFVTHTFLVLHLVGTFSTFIFGWDVVFSPHFPILTLAGEFVLKNLTLVVAGLVVLAHESGKRKTDPSTRAKLGTGHGAKLR
ncbi:MAG: hypothetical protein Q7R88_02185 [bacterium]|nr:hypothetical protein [bacterium]